LSKPFLTPAAAFAYATSLAVNVIVDFGVGNFSYTSSSAWPSYVVRVRGQGSSLTYLTVSIVSDFAVEIKADSLSLTVTATASAGAAGTAGDGGGDVTGGEGQNGGTSPDITILGSCTLLSVSSVGGAGGAGGQGVGSSDGESQGSGGVGGRGGDCLGTITVRCPILEGGVAFIPGSAGAGGANAIGGFSASDGSIGSVTGTTLITDGVYMVSASQSNVINWKAGRCSYGSSTNPNTDFGGNAVIS